MEALAAGLSIQQHVTHPIGVKVMAPYLSELRTRTPSIGVAIPDRQTA
jgi:hypothetical protein